METPTDKLRTLRDEQKCNAVVLLFCGSFSPVTHAHIQVLEQTRIELEKNCKHVIAGYLSPVHDGYGKAGLAPASARIHMLHLATASSTWLMVDEWEANQASPSPSYAVAQHLQEIVQVSIIFVCGADLVHSMLDPTRWPPQNVRRLLNVSTISVLRRENFPEPPTSLLGQPLIIVNVPELQGSSSKVRKLLAENQPINHLVHEHVVAYIERERLFSKNSSRTGP